jgi:transcriptional regulator with XRE-family HTH domain
VNSQRWIESQLEFGWRRIVSADFQWRRTDYMLTKHLENPAVPSPKMQGLKGRRSARIIMTNEARALRELRIMHGLSMRRAGELIGVSDSYISHIENGRVDFPRGERLDRFLAVYGGIKQKSFYERARKVREELTPVQELSDLILKLPTERIMFLLNFVKTLAG